VDELYDELEYYVDVILGREEAPLQSPYLALQEIASAYLARAYEIEMLIHRAESDRSVTKGSPYYRLRTGSLRSFIEMARKMCDLGSRRLSQEQLITQQRRDIGESF
jgi:hypothetical protein